MGGTLQYREKEAVDAVYGMPRGASRGYQQCVPDCTGVGYVHGHSKQETDGSYAVSRYGLFSERTILDVAAGECGDCCSSIAADMSVPESIPDLQRENAGEKRRVSCIMKQVSQSGSHSRVAFLRFERNFVTIEIHKEAQPKGLKVACRRTVCGEEKSRRIFSVSA